MLAPHRDARADRSRALSKRRLLHAAPDPLEPPVWWRRTADRLVIEVDDIVEYN